MAPVGVFAITPPQQAHAVGEAVFDAANFAVNTAIKVIEQFVSDLASSLNLKEFSLDPLAWFIAKQLIRELTDSIVRWIDSGFEGGPAFVHDVNSFMYSVVDEAIGEFIYGSELGFLCSPFQLDVKLALALNHRAFKDRINCRLSDVLLNVENFAAGTANWDGWFQLAFYDNPYARTLDASFELDARIINARGEQIELLRFGLGFLTWQECSGSSCKTKTPGSFIEDELVQVLGSPVRSLEIADEIDEIISHLFAFLVDEAFKDLAGLAGGGGGGGGGSYLDQLRAENTAPPSRNIFGQTSGSGGGTAPANPAAASLLESQYLGSVNDLLSRAHNAEALAHQLATCNPAEGSYWLSEFNSQSTCLRNLSCLQNERDRTLNNLDYLADYNNRRDDAGTVEEQEGLLDEFNQRAGTGQFNSIENVTDAAVNAEINNPSGAADYWDQRVRRMQNEINSCVSGGSGSATGGSGSVNSPGFLNDGGV